jgi:dihydroorotase
MYIDTHVHFRDFKEAYKETVRHGLEVARDSGVDAVYDMLNTDPPGTTEEVVRDRLRLADEASIPEVFYGVYVVVTPEREQVKRAVGIYRKYPRVVGLKMFAAHSTGNMGVVEKDDQWMIYSILRREGYNGVLAVHSEKESRMIPGAWDYRMPVSHCLARPEAAEIESVYDQTEMASHTGFKGKLHIPHISAPRAVDIVVSAKKQGLDVSCGVCPHHFMYDWEKMLGKDGLQYKMNPPLRPPESRDEIFRRLKNGDIDWIETDHAPHGPDKTQAPFMSGIVGLPWWNMFEEYLRFHEFSDAQIEDLTFNKAAERFGIEIKRSSRQIRDRRGDYPFNPYEQIEKQLGWKP